MRKYNENNLLVAAFCNHCGKQLTVTNGMITEGIFSVEYPFGYFSNKDEEIHKMDLCEICYDNWIKDFSIPVTIANNTEIL